MFKIFLLKLILLVVYSSFIISQEIHFEEHSVDDSFLGPAGIFVYDINGDSKNDIVAAGWTSNEIAWWRNEVGSPLQWTKQIVDNNFSGAAYVIAGDVNSDSLVDIVAAGWDCDEVAWWSNNGGNPITWTKNIVDSNFRHAHEVFLCDLDDDNDLDILGAAALDHTVAWWRNDGGVPIQWNKLLISSNFYGARSVYAEDIDGDNDKDVVGAALISNEIAWWRNDEGNPISWSKQLVSNNFLAAHKVHLFDLDYDLDMDILGTAYTSNEISWWRNDGGLPLEWTKLEVTTNFYGAVIAYPYDIDEDNDVDVIGSAQGSHQIAWWSNQGSVPFLWDKHQVKAGFGGAWPLHIGDIDGDTDIDIVVGGFTANKIKWWENSHYKADFVADSVSGSVPLQVQFTDQSVLSQSINYWEWDFDYDGTIDSYEQNPVWTYSDTGAFTVYLRVSDGQTEDTEVKIDYINTSIVSVENFTKLQKFNLHQNNPNPFNPSTTIQYELSEASHVTIKIFNVLGREIVELVNEYQHAGTKHINWNGKNSNGFYVNSGIYLYSLTCKNFAQTKKMLLIK